MVSLTGKCRRSVNASRCVKQDHRFEARLHPSTVHSRFFSLCPFYARSRSHTVPDSFLFQYLVTVMMARERESQTMSGCHVTKVFSTTFRFRPRDSRRTPHGHPGRDLYPLIFSLSQADGFESNSSWLLGLATKAAYKYALWITEAA